MALHSLLSVYLVLHLVRGQLIEGPPLRLVDNAGNTGGSVGRLEVFQNGRWGSVCTGDLDSSEGRVLCRQLGFKRFLTIGSVEEFGFTPELAWYRSIRCQSHHTRLSQCTITVSSTLYNCADMSERSVGLMCDPNPPQSGYCAENPDACSGNLMECIITSGSFDCSCTLGYTRGPVFPHPCTDIDECSEDGNPCEGLGLYNSQCINLEGGYTCDCGDGATKVSADPSLDSPFDFTCIDDLDGAVRLIGPNGDTRGSAGRVELRFRGDWYPVNSGSSLQSTQADLVCRQLGFSHSVYYEEQSYEQSDIPGALENFVCTGSEERLIDCTFSLKTDFNSFNSFYEVEETGFAVYCGGAYTSAQTEPLVGDLRLNPGGSSRLYSGRLEVYNDGQWGTVCNNRFFSLEASVACMQLGFSSFVSYGDANEIGFSQGSGPIWLDDVDCFSSSVPSLIQCSQSGLRNIETCTHEEDVGLICRGEGSLRLVNDRGSTFPVTRSSGRLEIFARFNWGTVCDNGVGQTEADVACRGLGFDRASSFESARGRFFGANLPTLLDDLDCTPTDVNLLLCDHNGVAVESCSDREDVVLHCTSALPVGSAVAVGLTVPLVVILTVVCSVIACCLCYRCKQKKSFTTTATTQPSSYPLEPLTHTDNKAEVIASAQHGQLATQNDYSTPCPVQPSAPPAACTTQPGPPYPSGPQAFPYPSNTYPSAPQQLPAAYPTGQAPPAPYSSGPQAPPAPHPSTQVQSGEDKKSDFHSNAPPAYSEIVSQVGKETN